MKKCAVILMAVALMAAGQASAEMILWDGSGSPKTAGYSMCAGGNVSIFGFDDPEMGIMHQKTSPDGIGLWEQGVGVTKDVGWTMSFGIEVVSSAHDWACAFEGGDDVDGFYMLLRPTSFTFYSNGVARGTWSHDLMADFALDFISNHAGQPFFLYGSFTLPHADYDIPDLGQYAGMPWSDDEKAYAAMVDGTSAFREIIGDSAPQKQDIPEGKLNTAAYAL